MRRRYRRCHLTNGPAAETSYSAAEVVKCSRPRVPSDDYGFAGVRPGMIASTPTSWATDTKLDDRQESNGDWTAQYVVDV